jgi:hypothetical protein
MDGAIEIAWLLKPVACNLPEERGFWMRERKICGGDK